MMFTMPCKCYYHNPKATFIGQLTLLCNYCKISFASTATLTITEISWKSENLNRPCSGDDVVYTCTQSGTKLTWNIPGLFEDPEAPGCGMNVTGGCY